MKKYIYYVSILATIVSALFLTGCDEDTKTDSDDIRNSITEPQLESFEPSSGAPGTTVMLTGLNFATADSVFIGGKPAIIRNRISNSLLLIEVSAESQSGKIKVRNSRGSVLSETNFEVKVVIPALTSVATTESGKVTIGEVASISGTNMKSVSKVLVGGVQAIIAFKSDTQINFVVPQLTIGSSVKVSVQYMNGTTPATVEYDQSFIVARATAKPTVTSAPTSALIGTKVTITGTDLDVVSQIILGSETANPETQTPTQLTFTVPTNFFAETKTDLIFVYNGTEQMVAVPQFIVTVPELSQDVIFYPSVVIEAQDVAMTRQFFNAKTGATYSACSYQQVKDNIYFFITWSDSNGTFQLNNPNNSGNQTAMFMCGEELLPNEKMPKVVKFRILRTTNNAENGFITKVKTRTLGTINPTVIKDAGIANASTSAPRFNYNNTNPANPFEVGSVLLFQKFDASGVTVEEVGFIEITKVNVPEDNKRQATMTFNCYFQK